MSKLRKLKSHLRRWGWLRTAFMLVMRAVNAMGLHVFVIRTRHVDRSVRNPCDLPTVEFRQPSIEEVMGLAKDASLDLDQEYLEAARGRGDIAFCAFDGASLIAYTWRTLTIAPHTGGLWVRVAKPYCYSYKSFARPAYRGHHLAVGLILYSDEEMLKQGYTHRAGFISVSNFPSLAMRDRLLSANVGYAGYIEWFGRYFTFRTRGIKDIGFEFFVPEEE